MHYGNLIIINGVKASPNSKHWWPEIESRIETIMTPYHEDWWDWYQIGGRWTGTLDGYNPELDPKNTVRCDLCNGTGFRTDDIAQELREKDPAYLCNGCDGTGKHVTWPTQWRNHLGDVMPVGQLTEQHLKNFYRVVIEDWGVFGGTYFKPWENPESGSMFSKLEMPPLEWLHKEFEGRLCVVVDNHN